MTILRVVDSITQLGPQDAGCLAVSGSRYSDNPGSRIVFLNGQVFREGDQPAPGVTIERIGLKSVILVGRGQRYELKY